MNLQRLTHRSRFSTKVGLLIGPRGNTLKKMETESQAKIAIRGKGSVKEGKGRSDAAHTSNQEEDLHCLIMADTEEKVNKAKKLIHQVIETVSSPYRPLARYLLIDSQAASIPEGQNELKRNQLRELAALNGTLRDDENQACQNCMSSLLFVNFHFSNSFQVVKSVIASMIAPSNAISLQISSVVSVATLGTWLEIVQIDSVERTGGMMHRVQCQVVDRLDALVQVMLLIENMRSVRASRIEGFN